MPQDRLQQLPTNNAPLCPRQSVRPHPFGAYSAAPGQDTQAPPVRLHRRSIHDWRHPCSTSLIRTSPWIWPLTEPRLLRHQSSLRLRRRRALWKALRSTGAPDFLTDLIAALHENTGAQVRSGNNLSNRFQATSGVRQGCILVPALFLFAIDWVLNHMSTKPGICVGTHQFNDLVYADDTTFFVSYASHAVECLSSFNKSSSVLGVRVSWAKTKLQHMGFDGHGHTSNITVNGNTVEQVDNFYTRQHNAIARICYRSSVCLSHGWIIQKRLKIGLWNLHHLVAPWF